MRRLLIDSPWARTRPLFPPQAGTGRPRAVDRRTLEAIPYVLRTAGAWTDVPSVLGDDATAHRRLRWQAEGVWERVRQALSADFNKAGRIDWSTAFLDGSFAPVKEGASVGLTGKGKVTRRMLVTDAARIPLGVLIASANTGEVRPALGLAPPRAHHHG
jgi:transposase